MTCSVTHTCHRIARFPIKKFDIETLLPFLSWKVGVVHHCVVHRGMTVFLGWMDERELTKRISFSTLLQKIYLLLNGY